MYYATVVRGEEDVFREKPFDTFECAVSEFASFYSTRGSHKGPLIFRMEVVNGKFARAYSTLDDYRKLDRGTSRYEAAVKLSNAYIFEGPLHFLIETDESLAEAERLREWDRDNE